MKLRDPQRTGRGCWVISTLKRFLMVIRCREYLSSGENRAGWAEQVCCPMGSNFCSRKRKHNLSTGVVRKLNHWRHKGDGGWDGEGDARKMIRRKTEDATVKTSTHTLRLLPYHAWLLGFLIPLTQLGNSAAALNRSSHLHLSRCLFTCFLFSPSGYRPALPVR